MRIACLHTAEVHVRTFDRIFGNLDGDVRITHHVDPSLLERARDHGIGSVRADVVAALTELSTADAVLCTCSTLGPLADEVARSISSVVRIDRPLMEQACADGGDILVALCLDSTRGATLELLDDCARKTGRSVSPVVVMCRDAWAFFEAGDMEAYGASIAASIKAKLAAAPDVKTIVLAQASMRVAEGKLADTGRPVRSAPEIAARRCLEVASAKARGTERERRP